MPDAVYVYKEVFVDIPDFYWLEFLLRQAEYNQSSTVYVLSDQI